MYKDNTSIYNFCYVLNDLQRILKKNIKRIRISKEKGNYSDRVRRIWSNDISYGYSIQRHENSVLKYLKNKQENNPQKSFWFRSLKIKFPFHWRRN